MTIRLIGCRIFSDILVLALISLSCVLINNYGYPFQRGYFLDDETIQYPYKKGSIDFYELIEIATVGPSIVIFIVELCIYTLADKVHQASPIVINDSHTLPGVFVTLYRYLGMLWVGLAYTEISTDIPKMAVGRLRPHFLTVCQPDTSILNSTLGYIVDNICMGKDLHAIDAARRSFPSGHASFAMFPVVYLGLYLIYRLRPWSALRMPVFLFNGALLNLAFYVGLTRISDFKHHWTDVAAGLALGAFVAVMILYLYGGNLFRLNCSCESEKNKYMDMDNIEIDNPNFPRQEMTTTQPF